MAFLKGLAAAAALALSVTAAGAVCDDFDEEKALAAAKEAAKQAQAQAQATQPAAPAKEAAAPAASPPAATDVATADPKPASTQTSETTGGTVRR
jgi:hypothetical protein